MNEKGVLQNVFFWVQTMRAKHEIAKEIWLARKFSGENS
jgi:hypothetical protein